MDKLLIVDDDIGITKQLRWALDDEYDVTVATSKEEALEIIKTDKFSLISLDVNLSGPSQTATDGFDILDELKSSGSAAKIIMITADDSKKAALDAIERGAFDYYVKPVNLDELKIILKRALYIQKIEEENKRLTNELYKKSSFENMIGSSEKMLEVFSMIKRISQADITVLITGESGTGKELAARAIHYLSPRKDCPFVVINCGAIPENLLESELFGHERGAFTDARTQRIGKLEAANMGTVFLDEIGEMSLSLQVKILRFLQERIIERLGANNPIELDVKIITATNSDLIKRVKEGTFREDLYYRLSAITLDLPPLRERSEDTMLLANYFFHKYKDEMKVKDVKGFNRDSKDAILSYAWPGNIREMQNKIRRAVILSEEPLIPPQALGFCLNDKSPDERTERFSLKEARKQAEAELIKKALKECTGNISLAAKMLGITRPTLYDLIKKYSIGL
ncbi:MAG: PEP-CTERM-box response regulator transcription factor [Candidatus Omnitrophota bacterium]